MRWMLAIIGCLIMSAVAGWAALWGAPASQEAGQLYRLLYLHVPVAVNALLAFSVAAGASLVFLLKRRPGADRWAQAAAGTGLLMATLMLATGVIWARLAWGTYWDFKSHRLMLALLLWILFLAYFLLRSGLEDGPRRPCIAAVFCLIAFLDVPLVYFSTKLVSTDIHPQLGGLDHPRMWIAFYLCLAAVTALHGLLLAANLRRVRKAEERRARDEQ